MSPNSGLVRYRARIVRRLSTVRLVLVALVAAVALVGLSLGPVSARTGAIRSQAVSDLEARLREAQAASDAAVARFQAATAEHETLLDEIRSVQTRIDVARFRTGELRAIVQQRAVDAYTSREVVRDATGVLFGGRDVMRELRRTALLERANARDDAAIDELRALDEDLEIQKAALDDARAEAAAVLTRLEAEKAALAATLAEAQRAYDDLVARLAREAASREAAERQAREAAASRRSAGGESGGGTPVRGFLCPVRGSFTNDYGDARSGGRRHNGVDIFAGTGTPVVAVASGSLSLESGGAGGNAAYLSGSDGNTYYFAHFSSYAGSARQVSQGEVIGYVGATGNASAPHLHFEIRTGGGAINPYPTLAASC